MEPAGDELRLQNAQLSRRVESQAVELIAARAAMDTLVHSISHDLRSPLTVISGFAELLITHSSQSLDEKGRHYLRRIVTSTIHIGQMMDEILALSRMSHSEMRCAQVDLEALVKKIVEELDASKGDRRVIWLIGRLPIVHADPTLLRRAITNLAVNALIFTRSREVVRIQIDVKDGGHEWIFFVRDNGAGFDVKHRERTFAAFQCPHSSSDWEGSAIGLAYVQRIIQRHGGRMWTEAVPDGGATFYFTLRGASAESCPLPEKR
jgi:light-regulated signal transduction histidine kinase (bacteriophytochrome)